MNEVVRYSMPSKYDVAKFGTICKVMGDNESFELFIQLGAPEGSDWKPINYLLEKTFDPFITNPDFISLCLRIFSAQGDVREHYKALSLFLAK